MTLVEVLPGSLWLSPMVDDPELVKDFDLIVNMHQVDDPEFMTYRAYVHCPIEDASPRSRLPNMVLLGGISRVAADIIRSGGRVLTHCEGGINRGPFMVACIVHELNPAMSGAEIRDHLRAVRGPEALNQLTFREYIETWEAAR